jgi:carbamoyl-phosphate synthase large subunit
MGDAQTRVMVAGIGGASLGTELLKCLSLAGRYEIFGCDISQSAYGLYDESCKNAYLVDDSDYISSVVAACHDSSVKWLVPGGEQPTLLLSEARDILDTNGIGLVANSRDIVRAFSDKSETFRRLASLGVPTPRTVVATSAADMASIGYPCVIKPSRGSGGSAMVFFALDQDEAETYVGYIQRAGGVPIAQEYIGHQEGEFTVGVLSLPDETVVSSIALRRSLDSKLSVTSAGRGGLISSGYTQGYIADFPDVRSQAEQIARIIGSGGPINIQGRVRDGVLVPFEINPRFSASCFLRALAGRNEVDWLLGHLALNEEAAQGPIREGWYLRSFTERYVSPEDIERLSRP